MFTEMDGFDLETTDARRGRLVGYHFHDALRHRREIFSGLACSILV